MSGPLEEEYNEAARLLETGDVQGCIARVQQNLNHHLPPNWRIFNSVLLSSILDSWAEADYWRQVAHFAYTYHKKVGRV